MPAVMEAIDHMTTSEKLETIDYLVSSISAAGEDLSDEWRSEVARWHEEVLRGDVDLVPFDESLRKAFARVASVHTSDKVGA